MNQLKQFCMAVVFTLVLTITTFAGEIQTGGIAQPPPPPTSTAVTTSGEIQIDAKDEADHEYQLLEDITLDLLRTMLSIF